MSKTGIIYGINGPVVYLKGDSGFKISEMVYVGKENLVGEVIGLKKGMTTVQVFEETTGLRPGETVTGTDGQQYVYDQSTGSWFLQSLIGAAAGAFIGNALANKFSKAPANSPAAQQVRTQYAQQYRGRSPQAPNSLSPRQQAAQGQQQNRQSNANTYRPTNQAQPNYQQPRRSGMSRGFGRRR